MKSRKAKNVPTKEKHKCSVTDIALKMAVVFFLENYKILIDELNPLPPRSNCAQTAAGAFCHHGRSR